MAKIINDLNYWQNYYKNQKMPFTPSLFAKYCFENLYVKKNSSLLELGCGNGRDAVFFAEKDVLVTAVDQSPSEIEFLKDKFKSRNLIFQCTDFSKINDFSNFDCIYSRFSLHAIDKEQEDQVVQTALKTTKKGTIILLEFRGLNNEYYGLGEKSISSDHTFFYEGHYRRFVDVDLLSSKFRNNGFHIVIADEKKGRAPFRGTDYSFARIIAIKR